MGIFVFWFAGDGMGDGGHWVAAYCIAMESETNKPVSSRPLHEQLTKSVIGGFYTVYNALGAGFLEAVYAGAMGVELRERGHKVEREIRVRVYYDGIAPPPPDPPDPRQSDS